MTASVVITKCYGVNVRTFRQTSRSISSGFQMVLSGWRLVKMTELILKPTSAIWSKCLLEINFSRATSRVLYIFILFSFTYWLVCSVWSISRFCFLSTYFNTTPRFVFFVAIPVSIVTIIYVDSWSNSKFYWVINLIVTSTNYIFSNTYGPLFTFSWHFEIQYCFLSRCVIYKLLLVFFSWESNPIITTYP